MVAVEKRAFGSPSITVAKFTQFIQITKWTLKPGRLYRKDSTLMEIDNTNGFIDIAMLYGNILGKDP